MNETSIPARIPALRALVRVVMPAACIVGVLLVMATPAMADVIFSTDFSSDPASNFASYHDTTVFDWDSENQRLHADRGTLYTGFYQLTNSAATSLADVVLQTTINVTPGDPNNLYAVIGGVQARIAPGIGSYTNGYYAVLGRPSWDRGDTALHLYLGLDIGSVNTSADMGTILGTGTYDASGNTSYQLLLSLFGTNLVAQLWDAAGDNMLDEISAYDATYSQGNVGYVSALRSASTHYYYDDLTVSSIPEPSTMLLLMTGALVLVCCRRMRTKEHSEPAP